MFDTPTDPVSPDALDQVSFDVFNLVSFDVFDTILLRRCTTPDGVYERTFAIAHPPVGRIMAEAFVQHRQLAETAARRAALQRAQRTEVTIDAIYDHFPMAIFGLEAADRPRLVQAELTAERELCFANPLVLEMARQARLAGARIGFVSDTYWNGEQLAALLRGAAPDLAWDFLYASCDHGRGKSEGLLERMLAEQGVPATRTMHLGDNPTADVKAARKAGMQTMHLPQCTPALAAVFQRESALLPLFCGWTGASPRLDGGARTARRLVAQEATGDAAFDYGLNVLGPVLAAFDRFVADRVARLECDGRRVAVAFLSRDGLAALEVWRASRDTPAAYIEVNRRVALLAAARTPQDLSSFFNKVPMLDHGIATSFLDTDTRRLRAAFQSGPLSGAAFARALPELISPDQLAPVSARVSAGLFAHLRTEIADFDDVTDLVLVDLGYSGTVQKGLRSLFSAMGLPHRLHGLYLISVDEELAGLPDGDSAEGLISDAVLLPHGKRALLSNVGILEQMCGAATGSVRGHAPDGTARHEPDPRPQQQLALAARIRQGAVAHARALGDQPPPDAAWAAAILARALLLPTGEDLALLGGMKHDVNLGSQVLVPLADGERTAALMGAMVLPQAFAPREVPAWMAAGAALQSPLHGYLYALAAAHGLPGDVAGDSACGKVEMVLSGNGPARQLAVTCLRNGAGDLRLRLPLRRADAIRAVEIIAASLPRRGLIRSLTLQSGPTAAAAMASDRVRALDGVEASGMNLDRGLFHATTDGRLIVRPPLPDDAIGILTLTITPLA